jgi:hypothetical protein
MRSSRVDYFINWRAEADLVVVPRQDAAQENDRASTGVSPFFRRSLGEPPTLLLRINYTAAKTAARSAPSTLLFVCFVTQSETINQQNRPRPEIAFLPLTILH